MVQREPPPKYQKHGPSSDPAWMVMYVNIEGLSSAKQQILAELCANHKCDLLYMQETHRGPGAVRPRVIRDSCKCESTSTSSTDNIEIIQLNGVTVNSYYKPPNQVFDFRSSTID